MAISCRMSLSRRMKAAAIAIDGGVLWTCGEYVITVLRAIVGIYAQDLKGGEKDNTRQ
jgi:hypothetical protein